MLKLASKFAMDIFPSVIATIIGAYIVNHYINNKTPADTATPAAAVSTADPKKASAKADSKPAEKSRDLANIPEPGVRAKGVPEKSIIDRSAPEKAAEKATEKADRPSETASIPPVAPAETRSRHQVTREKAAAKPVPAPVTEPVVAVPAAEPAPDANGLARAAIERLRGADPVAASRPQETVRTALPPEPARVVAAPPVSPVPVETAPAANAPSLQPLPPPILVSTPPSEQRPVNPAARRADDPLHPTPPADIPEAGAGAPLDLRADAAQPPKRPSVADDVLSAAKSMFHSVLPKP